MGNNSDREAEAKSKIDFDLPYIAAPNEEIEFSIDSRLKILRVEARGEVGPVPVKILSQTKNEDGWHLNCQLKTPQAGWEIEITAKDENGKQELDSLIIIPRSLP